MDLNRSLPSRICHLADFGLTGRKKGKSYAHSAIQRVVTTYSVVVLSRFLPVRCHIIECCASDRTKPAIPVPNQRSRSYSVTHTSCRRRVRSGPASQVVYLGQPATRPNSRSRSGCRFSSFFHRGLILLRFSKSTCSNRPCSIAGSVHHPLPGLVGMSSR